MTEYIRNSNHNERRGLSHRVLFLPFVVVVSSIVVPSPIQAKDEAPSPPVESLLATLKSTKPGKGGQVEAAAAWRQLAQADVSRLPTILASLDDADPISTNWIRTAAEAMVERSSAPAALPRAGLERFLLDRRHAPAARRFAYEILRASDPQFAERMLPGMLDDPSLEMRRDAVARVIDAADRLPDGEAAKAQYQLALDAARDIDQIRHVVEKLNHLGHTVDIAQHFGFVRRWKVIGPFNNRGRAGYTTVYPPEHALDFSAEYPGKSGTLSWHDFSTLDEYGQVDLNKALGRQLEAVAFAAADFNAVAAAQVELRVGTENACRVWLNGHMVLESATYHSLPVMDQFVGHGTLHAGHNSILVKLCQNEQTEEWARGWQFQLRVCDASGKAVQPVSTPSGGGQSPVPVESKSRAMP